MSVKGIDQAVADRYLGMVPLEVREAVSALSDDLRWAVYIALATEGEKYFTELKEEFGANPNTMTTVLKALVGGGLVARRVRTGDVGDRRKIYYALTPAGGRLFTALYDVALPPHRITRDPEPSRVDLAGAARGAVAESAAGTRGRYDHYDSVPHPDAERC
jgi:DNA-binding MarR family transcriptional regulator